MARALSTAAQVREFMRRLGQSATGPGSVYLVGGAASGVHRRFDRNSSFTQFRNTPSRR